MAFLIGAAAMAIGAGVSAYGAKTTGDAKAAAYGDAADTASQIAAQQAAASQHAIAKGEAAIELGQKRVANAEMARFNTMAGLGMPGSYEQGYEEFLGGMGGASPWAGTTTGRKAVGLGRKIDKQGAAGGMFRKISTDVTTPGAGPDGGSLTSTVTDYALNPKIAAEKIAATRSGRMVSYMTAQADQLVRREGPLWEEIKQSVHGPIIEGAGMAHQEMLEQIQTEAAKSGSARNRAVQMATQVQASQNIMRDKQNMLWQSNLKLIEFGIQNARAQLSFNDAWVSNRAGIRDQFNQMMNAFTEMRVNTIMPAEIQAANNYADSQQVANQLSLGSGLARADGNMNMYGAIGGAFMEAGGMAMGKGLTGKSGGGGFGTGSGYAGSLLSKQYGTNLISTGPGALPQTGLNAPGYG